MKTEALIDFETAQSPTTHPSTTMKREGTLNHTDTSPIKLRKNWNAREMQALFAESAGRTDHRIYLSDEHPSELQSLIRTSFAVFSQITTSLHHITPPLYTIIRVTYTIRNPQSQ